MGVKKHDSNKREINHPRDQKWDRRRSDLKRWYVAHVRHHEKKVAEYLGKMGIETFVPVQQRNPSME